MSATMATKPATDLLEWIKIALRGIGQVMFQGHAGTGSFFLIGLVVAAPITAVGAILGAVIGPLVAILLKYDRKEIEEGIYGFNPVLVGIALFFYLKPVILTWVLVVVGCALAAVVTYLMRRFLKFPTYTAPFIVCTWALLLLAHGMAGTAIDLKPAPAKYAPHGFFEAVLTGAAEVMFGANIVTGALFLVGIAVSSWQHALLALIGSIVGTATAHYHNDPQGTISLGIYGYNAALAAMAAFLWRRSLNLALLAALVSVPLTEFFPKALGIPPLTAPFVVATWAVIATGALGHLVFGNEERA